MKTLGWSRGKSRARFGDETGVWHLLEAPEDQPGAQARLACGSKAQTSGQIEPLDGHPCKRCKAIADKRGATDSPVYPVLLAESKRVGWPVSFATDLTEHDQRFLRKRKPEWPFVWCLRESGTHVIDLAETPTVGASRHRQTIAGMVHSIIRAFDGEGSTHFYVWDGTALVPHPKGPDSLLEHVERIAAQTFRVDVITRDSGTWEWRKGEARYPSIEAAREAVLRDATRAYALDPSSFRIANTFTEEVFPC